MKKVSKDKNAPAQASIKINGSEGQTERNERTDGQGYHLMHQSPTAGAYTY